MSDALQSPQRSPGKLIKPPPRQFFMSLRDIAFWIRSARTDVRLATLRKERGVEAAFDCLYSEDADPYKATAGCYRYQRLKYQRLLALLPARRYASALDIGCGLGVFSREIAPYADRVLGIDISPVVVGQARALSTAQPCIEYAQANVLSLDTDVQETFDLVVLADVLYYLSPLSESVLKSVRASVTRLLKPDGLLLLVNHSFFHVDPDSRTTRRIHDAFRWDAELSLVQERWHPFFLASVLQRTGAEAGELP